MTQATFGFIAQVVGDQQNLMRTMTDRLNHHESMEVERAQAMIASTKATAEAINIAEDRKLDRDFKRAGLTALEQFGPPLAMGILGKLGADLRPKPAPAPADDPVRAPPALATSAPVSVAPPPTPVLIEATVVESSPDPEPPPAPKKRRARK